MGSFYTSCALSNLQIVDGDPIVGFFVKPNDGYRAKAYGTYAWDFFKFASMPLIGTYADYGKIELDKKQSSLSSELLNKNEALDNFHERTWRSDEGGFVYFHKALYEKAIQMFTLEQPSMAEITEFINKNRDEYDANQEKAGFMAEMNLTHALTEDIKFRSLGFFFENVGGHDGIDRAIKSKIKRQILNYLDTSKYPEAYDFSDIPEIDEMMSTLYELHALSNAMQNLNKRIMPQFTSGQDSMQLEEGEWNTFLLQFSNNRIQTMYDKDWMEEETLEAFKEKQRPILEKQILDFGEIYQPNSMKKVNKV